MLHLPAQRGLARGRVFSELIDAKTREILMRSRHHNIITRAGLARLVPALLTSPPELITLCKVGTGLTTPADTDTGLTTLLESKDIGSIDTTNVTGSTPYVIVRTQFDEDEAIGSVTEIGLFGASFMFNHALFGSGNITGATQADPVVITSVAHGLVDGQRVIIQSVGGMTQLNNNLYYVDKLTNDTFALYNDASLSDTVDGTGYSAYTSGGTWKISIPKTSSTILVTRVELELANA